MIPWRFIGFTGMDYTAEDYSLDQQTLRVAQGCVINRRAALSHPGSRGNPVYVGDPVVDFVRYYRYPDLNTPAAVDAWVHVSGPTTDRKLRRTDPVTLATTDLANMLGLNFSGPYADNIQSSVVQVGGRVIAVNGDFLPKVWYGSGSVTTLGYPPPTGTALTFGTYAAGLLDTTGLDPYSYTASFLDRWGNETNPMDPLTPAPAPINQSIPIHVPTSAVPAGLAPTDVARVYIWRIGGNNSELRLAISYVPTISGGLFLDSATFASPVDNTPDSSLPDVFANYSNIPPPRGLYVLIEHIGRLFGAGESQLQDVGAELGSPSRLWFSRIGLYNSWGNTDDGIDDDGGYLDIDDNHYDKILGLASTGSVLVIGRLSSVYTLFGNGFQTFRFDKRSDVGIASRRAICRHGNVVRYVGSDGYPYELGNGDSVRIGRSVERYVDTLEDLLRTVCFSHNGRFFCCFPQSVSGASRTLVLDDRTGGWTVHVEFDIAAARSVEPPNGGKPVLMIAPRSGGIIPEWQPSNTPSQKSLEVRTDRIRLSPLGEKVWVRSLHIDGEFENDPLFPSPMTVTITVEGTVKTYSLLPGRSRLLYIDSLPLSLTGEWVEVKITGLWGAGEIRRIDIEAIPMRAMRQSLIGVPG